MAKDPYVQNDGILLNKLNITNYDELNSAEKDITFSKFLNIEKTFTTNFDVKYVQSIHKHIFEDIYDWAGKLRTVPIYKEEVVIPGLSLDYSEPKNIKKELTECLEKMNNIDWNSFPIDKKAEVFTQCLTEFWKIHPFRDGNTRTTLTFANQFAKEHGFPINLNFLLDQLVRKYDENGKITQFSIRDKFVLSAIPKDFSPEPEHLTSLIHTAMVSGISKNIDNLKTSLSSKENEHDER